jgi:hypothetical protein
VCEELTCEQGEFEAADCTQCCPYCKPCEIVSCEDGYTFGSDGVCPICINDISIDFLTTDDTTPILTGYVNPANLAAGLDRVVQIVVNGVTYTQLIVVFPGFPSLVTVVGSVWTLTIPNLDILPSFTIYDVEARIVSNVVDVHAEDDTVGELTIISNPTVDFLTFGLGGSSLTITGEGGVPGPDYVFTVEVNSVVYYLPDITIGGGVWSLPIPSENIEVGVFDVIASLENTETLQVLTDSTSPDLHVIDWEITVDPLTTTDTTPTITGQVRTLSSGESVVIGVFSPPIYIATVVGNTWSFTLPTPLAPMTYNVDAGIYDSLNIEQVSDLTEQELTIFEIPTVNSVVTSVRDSTISGTFPDLLGYDFSVTFRGVTYFFSDPQLTESNGDWFLDTPTSGKGTYSLVAKVENSVTNHFSTDSTNNELVIFNVPIVYSGTTIDTTLTLTGTVDLPPGHRLDVKFFVDNVPGFIIFENVGNVFDVWSVDTGVVSDVGPHTAQAIVVQLAAPGLVTLSEISDIYIYERPTSDIVMAEFNPTPLLTGTVVIPPGITFTVEVDGTIYQSSEMTITSVDPVKDWSLLTTNPISPGVWNVLAKITGTNPGNAPYTITSIDITSDELTIWNRPTVNPQTISNPGSNPILITGTYHLPTGDWAFGRISVTKVGGPTQVYFSSNPLLTLTPPLDNESPGQWAISHTNSFGTGTFEIQASIHKSIGNVFIHDPTTNELVIT